MTTEIVSTTSEPMPITDISAFAARISALAREVNPTGSGVDSLTVEGTLLHRLHNDLFAAAGTAHLLWQVRREAGLTDRDIIGRALVARLEAEAEADLAAHPATPEDIAAACQLDDDYDDDLIVDAEVEAMTGVNAIAQIIAGRPAFRIV